jgi:uncharacterized protein (DUF2267 family)
MFVLVGGDPMSMTGLDAFDATVHKSNRWLHELMQLLGWNDKHKAWLALKATLHALRDRLAVDEVAQLGAQLPMLIRGAYYEGWDPSHKPLKERHRAQFLAHVDHELASGNPERVAHAVFTELASRVSAGEIEDVKQVLPSELRDLWP